MTDRGAEPNAIAQCYNRGHPSSQSSRPPAADARLDEATVERAQGAAASEQADVLRPDVGLNGNGPHADPSLSSDRPSDAGAESAYGELLPDHLEFGPRPDVELLPAGETVADIDRADESVRQSAPPQNPRARRHAEQTRSQGLPSRLPHGPVPLKEVAQTPSEARSLPENAASADSGCAPTAVGSARWCAIVLKRSGRQGRFEVVARGVRGETRAVAESPTFKLSRAGQAPERGPAKAAHARLAGQLAAVGWTPVTTRGRWHDSSFVQSSDDVRHQRYLLIGQTRAGSVGRFQADEIDAYGKATLVEQSEEFEVVLNESDVIPNEAARSAHEQLVIKLIAAGWTADGAGRGEWYAAAMTKPQEGDHDETATT